VYLPRLPLSLLGRADVIEQRCSLLQCTSLFLSWPISEGRSERSARIR
jgi:hypothetical protein